MATKLMKIDGKYEFYGEREYLLDNESDINKLPREGVEGTLDTEDTKLNEPCEIGSTAMVCSPPGFWVLSPSNVWIKL